MIKWKKLRFGAKLGPMKIDPFLTDETKIAPPTPGAALVRLSQTLGALRRVQNANPMPENLAQLARERESLQNAIENGEKLGTPFKNAQNALRILFATIQNSSSSDDEKGALLVQLGFPDTRINESDYVAPVDVSTVCATHFKPQKQVFSTLAFEEAQGATAYWLFEIRVLADGTEAHDALIENYAPTFSRVRLPIGNHRFIIESRNPSKSVRSAEFSVDVPNL